GSLVVELADDGAAPRVRAGHEAEGTVPVYVVEAVLGVVLDGEDARRGPEAAVRDPLDDAPEGEVVVGDHGGGLGVAGAGAGGVVVGEVDEDEGGQVAGALEVLELLEEGRGADHVGDAEVPAGVAGAGVGAELLDAD